jgi:2'-5' RNA ligase
MHTRAWGFFALVSYVPDPLGQAIDRLRQSLPGDFRPTHITILPPRPLHVHVDEATEHSFRVLDQFGRFEVELTSVDRFTETNVLYLDVAGGSDTVHELHDALNTGDLSFPEEFEFYPHLTLGGPIPAHQVDGIQAHAEQLWHSLPLERRFTIDEIVALWAAPGDEVLAWQRLWTYSLRPQRAQMATAGLIGQRF